MLDPNAYDFCAEFYVVEKTIEVVVSIKDEAQQIRIEAVHGPLSTTGYSTRAFIKEYVMIRSESAGIWVDYDLPWTAAPSADAALAQALGFLGQRCRKP